MKAKTRKLEVICRSCQRRWYEVLCKGQEYRGNKDRNVYEIRSAKGKVIRVVKCPDCGEIHNVMRPYTLRERARQRWG